MSKRILIIQGHPDGARQHLCHALADAYADGARGAGSSVEMIEPAKLDFPLLSDAEQWQHGGAPAALVPAQEALARAEHVVLIYPLWLGDMPALLKGFLEQVLRPGFALARAPANPLRAGLLGGRSARVIVTMGMPSLYYRWFYRAHSVRFLRRNILHFVGIAPVGTTLIGGAGTMDASRATRWCARLRRLGEHGA
ncbi:NAD(P)H-dependent oxidoreductase [Massilia sp. ST3]|uniref:NAD(P)H-dependent oxidoreductase n=1 Tax=Massilia sp. ST3 TaxID=2824903 RepID=UPI001B833292|nr:NAD(P)H-dependent oxidoreductase [Massilia sp. ST3]MBQ5948485.1 NAD(P)H-dependent oxidoreductase [Massilia sp. ST3]